MSRKVYVTGAGGYVGRALVRDLRDDGIDVVPIVRRAGNSGGDELVVRDYTALRERDFAPGSTLVHLAARSDSRAKDARAELMRANVDASAHLAEVAAEARLDRLVFLSTAKVHGERGSSIRSDSPLRPETAYAESKVLAEERMMAAWRDRSLVVLRPPAVYGNPPKANFGFLKLACEKRLPLPVPSTPNRRSFLGIDNAVSAIRSAFARPGRGPKAYVLDEGAPMSTESFVASMGRRLHSEARLRRVSRRTLVGLDGASRMFGLGGRLGVLYEDFCIECTEFRTDFGWVPSHDTHQGLARYFPDPPVRRPRTLR